MDHYIIEPVENGELFHIKNLPVTFTTYLLRRYLPQLE